ncbi:DUF3173 family protein [Lactococcus lactis]|uniref:DUF3173 family protein n=1 Tax=Lactococcus lactis TaxID=1358 RepID=UPI0024A8ADE7|nr:DUF3173 family protein [Lactococcus lactis]
MITRSLVTVNYKDLINIGFSKNASKSLIQEAKKIAVVQFNERMIKYKNSNKNMIKYPCSPFTNPKVLVAPRNIVEELLGFPLNIDEQESTTV